MRAKTAANRTLLIVIGRSNQGDGKGLKNGALGAFGF
jgi:hypothetical protein